MKSSQSRQKSYHDIQRKAIEFQEGDHMFLRVTLVIGYGHAFKSRNLTLQFIGPYQILKRVRKMVYKDALLSSLLNPHSVSHESQLQKYILVSFYVIQLDDVQMRENLIVEATPLWMEDKEGKHLIC